MVKRHYSIAGAPTVNDDGSLAYRVGDTWYDTTSGLAYLLVSAAVGAAVWELVGGSAGGLGGVRKATVTNITTAGAETYTAAQILGGLITRDPAAGNRTDTLPTAALLVAALPMAAVGDAFEFTVKNTADMAETVTVQAGDGGTLSGDGGIAQNESKRFLVVITGVGTPAYTVYHNGLFAHNT